ERPELAALYIAAREDRNHAGQGKRRLHLVCLNAGVSMRTSQNSPVKHTGTEEIRDVARAANSFFASIDPRQILPNDVHAPASSATRQTASTILVYPEHRHRLPDS